MKRKPSVWFVIAIGLIASVTAFCVNGVLSYFSNTMVLNKLEYIERWQWNDFICTVATQLTTVFFVILTLVIFRSNLKEQLGLVKPKIHAGTFLLAILGTFFLVYLGTCFRQILFPETVKIIKEVKEELTELDYWGSYSLSFAWWLGLAQGVFPAVCEESLFRGLIQRRLLEQWRPIFAIAITSILFAAIHIDLQHIIIVFPAGLWLSYLAWRSGSLIPSMVCHFCWNGTRNSLIMDPLVRFGYWYGLYELLAWIIAFPALLVSLVLLERNKHR